MKIKLSHILGVAVFLAIDGFLVSAFLTTDIGMLALVAGGFYVVYLIYQKLDECQSEWPKTIYLLFFAFPTVFVISGGGAWLVGCLYGINSCRSPF